MQSTLSVYVLEAVNKGSMTNENTSLSARLMAAHEEERRSLARELHDEVGQLLNALLLDAAVLKQQVSDEPEDLRRLVTSIQLLAQQSIEVVRNTALLLRPSILDDLGLIPAVEWQAREVSRRTGMVVDVAVPDGAIESLPDSHKICLYRVVQEALSNCGRHASATTVSVRLVQEQDRVCLQVEDNGAGFDVRTVRGLGLLGMEERVRSVGGTLHVDSYPGAGTLIQANLPVPSPPG